MARAVQTKTISTWRYDDILGVGKGIGKVAVQHRDSHYQVFIYDDLGRPQSTISHGAYTTTYSYDSYSRLATTTYPTGYQVQRQYNAQGYLDQVQSTDPTPTVYWQANSLTARDQVDGVTYGNGLYTARTFSAVTGRLQGYGTANAQATPLDIALYQYDEVGNLEISQRAFARAARNLHLR